MCVTRKGAASLVTPSKGGNSPAMVAVFGSSRREREVVRELVVRERSRYRDRERERERCWSGKMPPESSPAGSSRVWMEKMEWRR